MNSQDIRIAILTYLDRKPIDQAIHPKVLAEELGIPAEKINVFLSAAANRSEVEVLETGCVKIHARLKGQFIEMAGIDKPLVLPIESGKRFNLTISQSTIGLINVGDNNIFDNIRMNISNLKESGKYEVSEALQHLLQAVIDNGDIEHETRLEIIEQLEEISHQATIDRKDRLKPSIINSVFINLATIFSAAGGLAEVWSVCGPVLKAHFGI